MSLILLCLPALPAPVSAQSPGGWTLEKMPADLETEFALSALPPHLRAGATVYLLDPLKGYYIGRQGTNGFVCFISRTEWEWGEFRKDLAAPIGFDPEGARTTFIVYLDVAAMRATGKYTALQIRDTVERRIREGIYTAPSKAGIAYMLAPLMRVYTANPGNDRVVTMSMPHYMFYAPYITAADAGVDNTDSKGPLLLNPGNTVLGDGKGPYGYFIMAEHKEETDEILREGKDLLKKLAEYKPYFALDSGSM